MARNRKTAKDAGTRFETAVEAYLQWALQDRRIQRLRLHGAKDTGDIGNIYFEGKPVVIECKDTSKENTAQHLAEAATEAGNADALLGVVVQKRRGIGIDSPEKTGQQLVKLTLHDFALLLNHGIALGPDE